jgi:RNA polymerase sigma-70 factor (ECF subfamily)
MALTALINEKYLLKRLREGEQHAFELLYRHYIDPVYRKIMYLVKSEDIAEELTQVVFMRIWEKRNSLDPNASFRSYLYSIAQNLVVDLYRRSVVDRKLRDHLMHVSTELYDPMEANNQRESERRLLKEAMESLPEQRRKVIALVKLEGKSYQEVSTLLGISNSTVRDHIVKGTKSLRAFLGKKELAIVLFAAMINADLF